MSHPIDRNVVRRFITLAAPFFRSNMRWRAIAMVGLLLGLSLTINGIGVIMSYIGRDFMTALQTKDSPLFYWKLAEYLVAFVIATPIVVSYSYTEQRLSLLWRRWLSHHILARYFSDRAYYKLNLRGDIDNPDQRIEEDVRSFCAQSLTFCLIFFNSTVQLLLYVYVLGSISGALLIAAVVYSIIGSVVTYYLGRPLIGLNFAQLKKEADYRYKLINVRDSAESIAFYGREAREFTRTRQRLKSALNNLLQVVNWNRNLQFFTTGYNYILTVLPTVFVAPLFFAGQIEFGSVIQAGAAFGFVINALSIVVNHFGNLSVFAAVINRLGTFWEALEKTNDALKPSGLYMTHIFQEDQIILTPDWLGKTVAIHIGLNHLQIRRPSTLDLILTKMMRGDDADLAEIGFLIKTGDIRLADLEAAYRIARVPIPEIGEIFLRSQTAVRQIYEIPPVARANP